MGKDLMLIFLNLTSKKYFLPEGDFILPAILRMLFLKKQPEYTPMTLGDLEEAVKKGKLV